MAVSPSPSPSPLPEPNPFKADPSQGHGTHPTSFQPDHSAPTPPPAPDSAAVPEPTPAAAENPAASLQSFSPSPLSAPPSAPSFRPVGPAQFSPIPPTAGYHNPGLQPPGVVAVPTMLPGAAAVPMPHMGLPGMYHNAPPRSYSQLPAGYAPAPGQQPLAVPPPAS